jgi:hypothetical protein
MRALIAAGVLGLGTAIVFAAAALTATLFPNGTVVSGSWNGPMMDKGWGGIAVPVPMPAPSSVDNVIVNVGGGTSSGGSLPGDIVVPDQAPSSVESPAP